jgi:hypothetical protein
MTSKTAAYWEGWDKEAARKGRNPLENLSVPEIAQRVASSLARDEGRKRAIYARSPDVFSGMDGNEFGEASSVSLAIRELKALGIDHGENDPLAILDAHHAGRKFARDSGIIGGFSGIKGGREAAQRLIGGEGEGGGSASDSADSGSLADKLAKHYGI